MSQTRAMNDVQLKRSWKMPVVYVLAALLQILFAVKVSGNVTIRLNDKSQSINIDDIVTPWSSHPSGTDGTHPSGDCVVDLLGVGTSSKSVVA